ncbi:MAG: hypothetical protein AAFU83_00260 [Bacteroidota bacterium]
MRWAARETLGKFSTQDIINYYWKTQDKNAITALATRLYEAAPTIEDIQGSDQQKVVLYPSIGDPIKWTKPKKEVQHFKWLIQKATRG